MHSKSPTVALTCFNSKVPPHVQNSFPHARNLMATTFKVAFDFEGLEENELSVREGEVCMHPFRALLEPCWPVGLLRPAVIPRCESPQAASRDIDVQLWQSRLTSIFVARWLLPWLHQRTIGCSWPGNPTRMRKDSFLLGSLKSCLQSRAPQQIQPTAALPLSKQASPLTRWVYAAFSFVTRILQPGVFHVHAVFTQMTVPFLDQATVDNAFVTIQPGKRYFCLLNHSAILLCCRCTF